MRHTRVSFNRLEFRLVRRLLLAHRESAAEAGEHDEVERVDKLLVNMKEQDRKRRVAERDERNRVLKKQREQEEALQDEDVELVEVPQA